MMLVIVHSNTYEIQQNRVMRCLGLGVSGLGFESWFHFFMAVLSLGRLLTLPMPLVSSFVEWNNNAYMIVFCWRPKKIMKRLYKAPSCTEHLAHNKHACRHMWLNGMMMFTDLGFVLYWVSEWAEVEFGNGGQLDPTPSKTGKLSWSSGPTHMLSVATDWPGAPVGWLLSSVPTWTCSPSHTWKVCDYSGSLCLFLNLLICNYNYVI